MTSNTLKENVGKTLLWDSGRKMLINVRVLDARQMYGRVDLLITPVSGQGEQWVSAESCKQQETK